MLHIGLTGGIATGKSTVARMFQKRGAELLNLDKIAHRVLEPGSPSWEKLLETFGETILHPDKTINRVKLAKIVFEDRNKLRTLENITHPAILELWQNEVKKILRIKPETILISEVPLLFEKNLTHNFDATILVYAPPTVQIERLIKRDGISRADAAKRLEAQMPIDKKLSLATYVIHNDQGLDKTERQVQNLWDKLVQKII